MRKNLMLTAVLALMLVFAGSAFGGSMMKSSWFLSGGMSAGFSSAGGDLNKNANGDSETMFHIAPAGGIFIVDGLAIGATANFGQTKQGDYKATDFAIGPMIMFYPTAKKMNGDVKGKIMPFISGYATIGQDKTEYGPNTDTFKSSRTNFGGEAGGTLMLTNSLGIFGEAYFEAQKYKQKEPTESASISGTEFGVYFGVIGFFGPAN